LLLLQNPRTASPHCSAKLLLLLLLLLLAIQLLLSLVKLLQLTTSIVLKPLQQRQ
jgi:hypothetical protein